VVNRGGSNPLVVDVTSNAAVLFTAPVTPIPICACKWFEAMKIKQSAIAFKWLIVFFIWEDSMLNGLVGH